MPHPLPELVLAKHPHRLPGARNVHQLAIAVEGEDGETLDTEPGHLNDPTPEARHRVVGATSCLRQGDVDQLVVGIVVVPRHQFATNRKRSLGPAQDHSSYRVKPSGWMKR